MAETFCFCDCFFKLCLKTIVHFCLHWHRQSTFCIPKSEERSSDAKISIKCLFNTLQSNFGFITSDPAFQPLIEMKTSLTTMKLTRGKPPRVNLRFVMSWSPTKCLSPVSGKSEEVSFWKCALMWEYNNLHKVEVIWEFFCILKKKNCGKPFFPLLVNSSRHQNHHTQKTHFCNSYSRPGSRTVSSLTLAP